MRRCVLQAMPRFGHRFGSCVGFLDRCFMHDRQTVLAFGFCPGVAACLGQLLVSSLGKGADRFHRSPDIDEFFTKLELCHYGGVVERRLNILEAFLKALVLLFQGQQTLGVGGVGHDSADEGATIGVTVDDLLDCSGQRISLPIVVAGCSQSRIHGATAQPFACECLAFHGAAEIGQPLDLASRHLDDGAAVVVGVERVVAFNDPVQTDLLAAVHQVRRKVHGRVKGRGDGGIGGDTTGIGDAGVDAEHEQADDRQPQGERVLLHDGHFLRLLLYLGFPHCDVQFRLEPVSSLIKYYILF